MIPWKQKEALLFLAGLIFLFPSYSFCQVSFQSGFADSLHGSGNTSPLPSMDVPSLYLSGIPLTVSLTFPKPSVQNKTPYEIRIFRKGKRDPLIVLNGVADLLEKDEKIVLPSGTFQIIMNFEDVREAQQTASIRIIPGIFSILPPLLAIFLAIVFRQVVIALLAGIFLGAFFIYGYDPFAALGRLLDRILVMTIADRDHSAIILFTLLLGGMVGLISRSGGLRGLAETLARFATSSRKGQIISWIMGMIIFFDDYASTLIVGNTMRPLTDRLKISREKLSYIIDSTAAPIASLALISTWIGFEISLIGDSFKTLGIDRNPYQFFLATIPYRFYPIFALFIVVVIAFTKRDIGPMALAEKRSLQGQLLREGAVPLSSFDHSMLSPSLEKPTRWFNALLPIGVVIIVTFSGLWFQGLYELHLSGNDLAKRSYMELLLSPLVFEHIGIIFSAANSYHILLWASFAGALTAILLSLIQKILSLGESIAALLEGMKSMLMAIVILALAWSIKLVCDELHTSLYLVQHLSEAIPYHLLPALIFLISCFISFATGTSWGTMGIMIPLIIPLSSEIAKGTGLSPEDSYTLLLGSVSSILAGAVFGDHCSPISDTTILSSMASSSDHIDHVRTQIPYALLAAGVGLIVGDIPAAWGLSPFISIAVGMGLLYLIIRFLGTKTCQ